MTVPIGPRHRSSRVARIMRCTYQYHRNGQIVADYSKDFEYLINENTMDDVVVENYKQRSAAGEIFNNPMLKVDREVYTLPSNHAQCLTSSQTTTSGQWPRIYAEPLDSSPDLQDRIDIAVTKAYSKVTSNIASIPVTLGELKETKEMLFSAIYKLANIRKLLKFYNDKLKLALDRGQRWRFVGKEILDSWMAVRFGWLPFYGDVKNIYNAMTILRDFAERQTFRAGETLTFQDADTKIIGAPPEEVWTYSRTYYETVNISCGVLCSQRYGGVPDTYGLTKIPQTLWELTRLSWALDYFFNVAEVIASFTPDSLWQPEAAWVTLRRQKLQVITLSSYTNGPTTTGTITGGEQVIKTESVQRTPNPARAGIHFRPRIDWARYIDLVGVAKQPVKKLVNQAIRNYQKLRRR